MPGLAQHRQPNHTSRNASFSGLDQGAFSHAFVLEANTGRSRSDIQAWLARDADRQRLEADTERFAEILEQQGIPARTDLRLVAVGLITGQRQELEGWRNTNVLPVPSSRNRAAMLRELEFFMRNHPKGQWLRYAVVTFGERVELFGDLRDRVRVAHRRISKWASWAKAEFGVHVVDRHGELTVDERLSIHPHSNVLYYLERPLSKERWAEFLWRSAQKFGARWQDNGRVRNANEIVKYFFKGDDLTLMADLACAVPDWADGAFDPAELAHMVAVKLAAKANKGRSDRLPAEAFFGKALQLVLDVAGDLRRQAAAGASHPLVWLFHEMFGLRVATPMGELRQFRAGLRIGKERVVGVFSPETGYGLRKVRKQTRERTSEGIDVLLPENEVLAFTLPQPRFSPYAEPVLLVRNFTAQPRTRLGALALNRMAATGEKAKEWWNKAGAPDPKKLVAAVNGARAEAGRQEETAEGGVYRSHYYDNCPAEAGAEMPFCRSDGSLVDRRTGEVVFEPRSIPEIDIFDPRNWFDSSGTQWGSGKRYQLRWHYDSAMDGCWDE
ncbi:hypothetical protein [Telmatospirillum siberiense]|uniref:hypothetical protein n=1 Tax=Telmatospirillum siberiense TaxID=382514 RepID=UPI0011AF2D61|nr:hypothetical protein [Telmatospirillum siberiense]